MDVNRLVNASGSRYCRQLPQKANAAVLGGYRPWRMAHHAYQSEHGRGQAVTWYRRRTDSCRRAVRRYGSRNCSCAMTSVWKGAQPALPTGPVACSSFGMNFLRSAKVKTSEK